MSKYFRLVRPLRTGRGIIVSLSLIVLAAFAAVMQTSVFAVPAAGGGLVAVGPISASNGFPVWYKDANAVTLELCVDVNDPLCGFLPGAIPNPNLPVSFPDNFPDEAFYTLVGAAMDTNVGGRAILVLGLEAAFATGPAVPGAQVTFGRVRIWVDNLAGGETYTVTHPYGVDVFPNVDPARRGIRFTEDIGIGAPGTFDGALNSRVGPFLSWDPPTAAPPGYLGDPGINHAITGSPYGTNYFRIEGPNVGELGSPFLCNPAGPRPLDCIQTSEFSLVGKIATVAGVEVVRATYSRSAASSGSIDVFASSQPFEAIHLSGIGFDPTAMRGQGSQYFARVDLTGTVPSTVTISNVGDRPATVKTANLTDEVTITEASFDTATRVLTITATSSDLGLPPNLRAVGLGDLTAGTYVTTGLTIPPPTVAVTSTAGGADSRRVLVSGPGFGPVPVQAHTGPNLSVQQAQLVLLDGSASTGLISGYLWQQTGGTSVTLTGASSAVASFTAPPASDLLTFTLTVNGVGGPSIATIVVTVLAVAAPVANAGIDQVVPQGTLVTLDGSASTGAAQYAWVQTSGPTVTLTGAGTATPTFTFPSQNVTLIFQLTVTGPGGSASDLVQVSAVADVLGISRAEFRTSIAEWRVAGTATILASNTITIHNGSLVTDPVVGTASVDTVGVWTFRATGSTVLPGPSRAIFVESSKGGRIVGLVNVRR